MQERAKYLVGGAAALLLHAGLGASLSGVNPRDWVNQRQNVEMEVVETPPPPPPAPPPPEAPEPPPPPPKQPRVVMRRVNQTPPPEAPRPPPSETPPEPPKETAPPTFGVTVESTVTGDSAMAVPVGDTVGTNDRTPRKPAPQPASQGPPVFAPVPESYIAEYPKLLKEVKEEGPPETRRLGLEGSVGLRVAIDRNGNIRWVKVSKPAGYGFDEVATRALYKFKFSPARTNDGKAVDFVIPYKYTFTADK
jgi:protein TonB